MELLGGDNLNLRRAAELLNSEPSLAAQILRLANSPLFGVSREVTSLLVALNLLGIDRVYSLALTSGIRRLAAKTSKWPVSRRIWQHSLATAFLAADLSADHCRDMSEDYTAGLLHDIGRLILLAAEPAEYQALIDDCAAQGADSRDHERAVFGLTHEEAGGESLRRFGFPDSLCRVAAFHHAPAESSSHRPLVELIQSCSETASLCGFFVVPPQTGYPPEDDLCLYLRERMIETEQSLAL